MRRVLVTVLMTGGLVLSLVSGVGATQHRKQAGPRRSWPLQLRAPAPLDYALGEVSFSVTSRVQPKLALSGPIGADYVTAARLRSSSSARLTVLVLIVDRATALEDPASIKVSLRLSDKARAPRLLEVPNGFASRASGAHPALCALPIHRGPFVQDDLRRLRSAGQALAGFSSLAAITQAYSVICGLPFQAAFQQAVTQAPSTPAPPTPTPTPTPPSPVPTPPGPPGCQPCNVPPGYACPLAAHTSVCIASIAAARPNR